MKSHTGKRSPTPMRNREPPINRLSQSVYRNPLFALVLLLAALSSARSAFAESWTRITFPSEKHKNDGFLEYGGEMRGQKVNFFGVSPANPNFMIQAGNQVGQTLVAQDGVNFFPSGNKSGRAGTAFGFSPHDGALAFGVYGFRTSSQHWESGHPFGIWRTTDTGSSWEHVLELPENPGSDDRGEWPGLYGKRILLVDPSPNRADHVYFASGTRGLMRSTEGGDLGTWSVFAFEDQYVKTLAAGVSTNDITRLYAIVGEDNNARYRHGKLYRIEIKNTGEIKVGPVVVANEESDIADVEVNHVGGRGFVIRDGSGLYGESTGGAELYGFKDKGDTLFTDLLLDNSHESVDELGAIFVNPCNDSHWVVPRGGDAAFSFVWSNDGGETWNDQEREVSSGGVKSLVQGNPEQHHVANNWLDASNGIRSQGHAVGFMNASTVVWQSTAKDRPIFKSEDYGENGTHFTTGAETKWVSQINTGYGGDVIGVALGEYGLALSIDGGLSWKGYTAYNTDDMKRAEDKASNDGVDAGGQRRRGIGIAFNESATGGYQAISAHSAVGYLMDVNQVGSDNDWTITMIDDEGGDPLSGVAVFDEDEYDYGTIGEVYAVDEYVYMGSLMSDDYGVTFRETANTLGEPMMVFAVSSENGEIAVATPNRDDVASDSWALYATIDGGTSWVEMPKPNKEAATRPNGNTLDYYPVSFDMFNDTRHAIAIDPRPEHDPHEGGSLRVLMGGRLGVYEFNATASDGSAGDWSVNNEGLDPSIHFGLAGEEAYFIGGVQFDPRINGLAYAFKTTDKRTLSDWNEPNFNVNTGYFGGGTFQPVYFSEDWGRTWSNMHDTVSSDELPDWLTVSTIHVSKEGVLYVGSCSVGLYRHNSDIFDRFQSGLFSGGSGWGGKWKTGGDYVKADIHYFGDNAVAKLYDNTRHSTTNVLRRSLDRLAWGWVLAFDYDLDGERGNSSFEVSVVTVSLPDGQQQEVTVWDSAVYGSDLHGEPDALKRVSIDLSDHIVVSVKFKYTTDSSHSAASEYLFIDNVGFYNLDEQVDMLTFVEDPIVLPDSVWGAPYVGDLQNYIASPPGLTPTFTKVSGPSSDDWLTIASDGTLTGTPTTTGLQEWTVRLDYPSVAPVDVTLRITTLDNAYFEQDSEGAITGAAGLWGVDYSDALSNYVSNSGLSLNYTKVSGPSWLSVASDGTLSGVPDTVGENTFEVAFNSGQGSAAGTAVLSISVRDHAYLTSDPAAANWNTPYEDNLLNYVASSVGTEGMTFSKVSGPSSDDWLTIASDGSLSGAPTTTGSQQWTVRMTHPSLGDVDATFSIATGHAAYFTADSYHLGVVDHSEGGSTFAIQNIRPYVDTSADWDDVTSEKTSGPSWVTVASYLGFPYHLWGDPSPSHIGENTFEVRVTVDGVSDTALFSVTVVDGVVAFDSESFDAGSVVSGEGFQYALADKVTSTGSGSLQFSYSDVPSWLTTDTSGSLSGTPSAADAGSRTFTATAARGANSDTATVAVTVLDAAVEFDSGSFSAGWVYYGRAFNGSLSDDVTTWGSGPLSFSKTSGPAWLTVGSDGTLSGTPGVSDIRINVFEVAAAKGSDGSDSATIRINVKSDLGFDEDPTHGGVALPDEFFSADVSGAVSYGGSGTLAYSKLSGPSWVSVSSSGIVSGTPSAADAGPNQVVVSVTDGVVSDSAIVEVDVGAIAAKHGFGSGDWTGGSGWSGSWAPTGDCDVPSNPGYARIGFNTPSQIERELSAPVSDGRLDFDYYYLSPHSSRKGRVEVYDGNSWTVVWEESAGSSWTVVSIDLYGLGEISKVRFVAEGGGQSIFYVDNVKVIAP